jgi:ornithine decarboxylase
VARILSPAEPLQCFCPAALDQQIKQFATGFPGDIAYAVKANPSPAIIRQTTKSGLTTFDVASPAEMRLVKSIAPNATLHYHNPVRSTAEIQTAWHDFGCKRYSVDELSQLKKIASITGLCPEVEIAVRFRLPAAHNSVHDFSEKFGLAPRAAAHLLKQVAFLGFKPVLTFHPGSQCTEPSAWQSHIEAAAKIATEAGVVLTKLNVGGGFPAHYAHSNAPDLSEFFTVIKSTLQSAFEPANAPSLECEPGRAIVAPGTSLITRVKMVRQDAAEVFINDGIYGSLLEPYQAPALQASLEVISYRAHAIEKKQFTIFGPTCDPLDRLPKKVSLPADIAEDDFIEFTNVGAYSNATSTRFNGYGHAQMVFVDTLR